MNILRIIIAMNLIFPVHIFSEQCPPWITIWVHGTHPDELIIPRVAKLIDEKKYHNFFTTPNWVRVQDHTPEHHFYHIAQTLAKKDPTNYPFEHIYLSGWSGKLDFAERKQCAQKLMINIKELQTTYHTKYGALPRIRIITHSHGGNVALNMASWNDDNSVIIDELILLACPVQKETEHFVHHDMFKKVYSLHSHVDMIQILDPQGWQDLKPIMQQFFKNINFESFKKMFIKLEKPFFSQRHFTPNPKLIQADVRSNYNRGLMHLEFKMLPFMEKLPAIIDHLNSQASSDQAEMILKFTSF